MPNYRSIHHINFIVRDLESSVKAYEQQLGLNSFEFAALKHRGVRTARTRIGETWLVLVAPDDSDSLPGRHLAEHGEGFFLLSFGVDDLDQALAEFAERNNSDKPEVRTGLDHWRVADLDTLDSLGARFHLTELTKPQLEKP